MFIDVGRNMCCKTFVIHKSERLLADYKVTYGTTVLVKVRRRIRMIHTWVMRRRVHGGSDGIRIMIDFCGVLILDVEVLKV